MKKIFLFLMIIIFITGCTTELDKDSSDEPIIEKIPAEEPKQAEKQITKGDCTDYDKNQEECLKYKNCEWVSGEELCENLGGFDEEKQWRTETADDDGWVGIDSSIAVGTNGNPHISHFDAKNKDLKYAYKKDGVWYKEVIDSKGHVGEESGISVDDKGNIHISYNDATNGALKYAKKVGSSWSLETIDKKSGYHVVTTSLALDSNGNPHIAYNMESPNKDFVGYASWDGSSWKKEEAAGGGVDVDLALDSNDNPHIAFVKGDQGNKRIYYTRKTSGKWEVSIVDSSTIAGGDCGIDVDSKNYAHITYHDYGTGAIKYAKWDGDSWGIQTVASNVGKQEGLRLAIDSQDHVHIVYVNDVKEKLMHAFFDGSWTNEIVTKMGIPSITIDHLDAVHVSHGSSSDEGVIDPETGEEIEILKYSVRK